MLKSIQWNMRLQSTQALKHRFTDWLHNFQLLKTKKRPWERKQESRRRVRLLFITVRAKDACRELLSMTKPQSHIHSQMTYCSMHTHTHSRTHTDVLLASSELKLLLLRPWHAVKTQRCHFPQLFFYVSRDIGVGWGKRSEAGYPVSHEDGCSCPDWSIIQAIECLSSTCCTYHPPATHKTNKKLNLSRNLSKYLHATCGDWGDSSTSQMTVAHGGRRLDFYLA